MIYYFLQTEKRYRKETAHKLWGKSIFSTCHVLKYRNVLCHYAAFITHYQNSIRSTCIILIAMRELWHEKLKKLLLGWRYTCHAMGNFRVKFFMWINILVLRIHAEFKLTGINSVAIKYQFQSDLNYISSFFVF